VELYKNHIEIINGHRDLLTNFENYFNEIGYKNDDYVLCDDEIESQKKIIKYCHYPNFFSSRVFLNIMPYDEDMSRKVLKVIPPVKRVKNYSLGKKYLIADYFKGVKEANELIKNNPDKEFILLIDQTLYFEKPHENATIMYRQENLDVVFEDIGLIIFVSQYEPWGLFVVECCGTGIPVCILTDRIRLPFIKRAKDINDYSNFNSVDYYLQYWEICKKSIDRMLALL